MQHLYCWRNKNLNITLRMLFYLNVLYILYLLRYIVLYSKISQQFKEKRNRQLFTWLQQRNIRLGTAVEGTLRLFPSECSDKGEKMLGISAGVRMAMLGWNNCFSMHFLFSSVLFFSYCSFMLIHHLYPCNYRLLELTYYIILLILFFNICSHTSQEILGIYFRLNS